MKRIDLGKIKKTRFGYEEVLDIAPELSYEELHEALEELCREERIVPVKKSGKTSFVPQVFREYRKVAVKQDYSHLLPEIKGLHPSLSIDRYLKNPKEFQESGKYVRRLSELLWKEDACLAQWMSVKEKSYAVWGEEKFLESRQGRALLAFHHLDWESLHCYYAPEPFFCRVFQPEGKGDVLILENKDTWYSIGRALKESGTGQIFGIFPGLLVYGEGNKITREQEGLTAFLEEMGYGVSGNMGCSGPDTADYSVSDNVDCSVPDSVACNGLGTRVYYAGDIDRAGVNIFCEARRQNPGLSMEPCLPLYRAMVQRALLEEELPEESGDGRSGSWDERFLEYFSGESRDLVRKVLEENRRIPQEILNYQDYKNMCRGQSC